MKCVFDCMRVCVCVRVCLRACVRVRLSWCVKMMVIIFITVTTHQY